MPQPPRTGAAAEQGRAPAAPPPANGKPARRPRQRGRLAAAAVVGALVMLFAVLNIDEVEVNWVLGTWSTPLIVVIALSFILGAAADRLVTVRRRPRKARKP